MDCVPGTPLILNGLDVELLPDSPKLNGNVVPQNMFIIDGKENTLTIFPDALPTDDSTFSLESTVRIKPAKNTELEGL